MLTVLLAGFLGLKEQAQEERGYHFFYFDCR